MIKNKEFISNEIINNFENFTDSDADLIETIFKIFIPKLDLLYTINYTTFKSATLADVIFRNNFNTEMTSLIPFVAANLIQYKKSTVRKLFINFPNIMGLYSSNLLKQYSEIKEVLIDVDLKYTMNAFLQEKEFDLFEESAKNKTLKNQLIFDQFSSYLSKNIKKVPESLFTVFLDLYCRSFGNTENINCEIILEKLVKTRENIFDCISKQFISKCSVLFNLSFNSIYKNIISSKDYNKKSLHIAFITDYLKYGNISVIIDSSIFIDKLLKSEDLDSSRALNEFIKLYPEFADNLYNSILKIDNIKFKFRVLLYQFQNCSLFDSKIKEVLSMASKHVDSSDSEISDIASEVFEYLQFK